MSLQALHWALDEAPDVPPHLVSCLLGMANHADDQGRGVYLSWATLARYTRKSERAVSRDLRQLEDLGLIRRGDQRFVAHLPADKRPVVYDLAMERKRPPAPPPKRPGRPAKKRGDAHVIPNGNRGDAHVIPNGNRGDAHVIPNGNRGDAGDKSGCRPRQIGVTPTSPKPSLNLGRTFLPSEVPAGAAVAEQAGRQEEEGKDQAATTDPATDRAAAELVDGLEWPGVISRARITASRRTLITAAASALASGHHPDAVRATAQEAMPGAKTPGSVVAALRTLASKEPDPAVAAAAQVAAAAAERKRLAATRHEFVPVPGNETYCQLCGRSWVNGRVHGDVDFSAVLATAAGGAR